MKRVKVLIVLIFFCNICLFLVASNIKTEPWNLVKNENGIQVYVRKVVNSDFNEFKGVLLVNARIEVIGEILRDIPYYKNWIPDCTESSIVRKIDANNFVLHYAQKLPWPASNRDVVLNAKAAYDYKKGIFTIDMISINDSKCPKRQEFERMVEMKGSYILEYLDREHTKVTYIVRANPGGSLPSSVVNASSKDIPYSTLMGMKRMTVLKKFIDEANKSEDKLKIEEMISNGFLKIK